MGFIHFCLFLSLSPSLSLSLPLSLPPSLSPSLSLPPSLPLSLPLSPSLPPSLSLSPSLSPSLPLSLSGLLPFNDSSYAPSVIKTSLCLQFLFDTLHICFLHDKGSFLNKERSQQLMEPLVEQVSLHY